ncbi:hypothetical protein M9H77_02013 [Catharanthus roseus]|uniref:Uncharacterized protein n=1 Tax=Catharanthus roseus TaxID=4058 RepID=A0ACC0C7L7_CATRO|nr:hypothetical protein M9H77_02013 [Catharanthus roseus]
MQLRGNDHTYLRTQHASHVEVWHQWRRHIRDGPVLTIEVYIRNPGNRDTRMARYRLAGVHRQMMTSMLQEPSRRRPWEPILHRGACGVKRSACRLPGVGAREGRPPTPPDLGRGHTDPGHGREMGEGSGGRGLGDLGSSYQVELFDSPNLGMRSFSLGLTPSTLSNPPTSYMPPPSGLGFSSFQSPHPPGIGSSLFYAPPAPPPPYTVGSSTQHMPISTAFSSNSDEHDDEPTDVVIVV